MFRQSRKALSLEELNKHQKRIQEMVRKASQYKPTFHINKSYKKAEIDRRMEQRQKEKDELFQKNMSIINRIESTGPKINTKRFPQVKNNQKRLKTLSQQHSKTLSKSKFIVKDAFRNEDELFEENIKLIVTIQSTGPKVACWTSKKVLKLKAILHEKKREQEKQILNKFKEISKAMHVMSSLKRNTSSGSLKSKKSLTTIQ